MVVFRDMDGSPTKAWMIHHREEDDVEPLYELAFGKRPRQELYDLSRDPDTMVNVAEDPTYQDVCKRMEQRLLTILKEQGDPRVMAQPCKFEYEPYAGPVDRAWFENAATIEAIGPTHPAPAAQDPLPLPDSPQQLTLVSDGSWRRYQCIYKNECEDSWNFTRLIIKVLRL